jgi:hypothetical protein
MPRQRHIDLPLVGEMSARPTEGGPGVKYNIHTPHPPEIPSNSASSALR